MIPGEKVSEMPDFGHPEYRSPGSHVEMLPGSPGGLFGGIALYNYRASACKSKIKHIYRVITSISASTARK